MLDAAHADDFEIEGQTAVQSIDHAHYGTNNIFYTILYLLYYVECAQTCHVPTRQTSGYLRDLHLPPLVLRLRTFSFLKRGDCAKGLATACARA